MSGVLGVRSTFMFVKMGYYLSDIWLRFKSYSVIINYIHLRVYEKYNAGWIYIGNGLK